MLPTRHGRESERKCPDFRWYSYPLTWLLDRLRRNRTAATTIANSNRPPITPPTTAPVFEPELPLERSWPLIAGSCVVGGALALAELPSFKNFKSATGPNTGAVNVAHVSWAALTGFPRLLPACNVSHIYRCEAGKRAHFDTGHQEKPASSTDRLSALLEHKEGWQ